MTNSMIPYSFIPGTKAKASEVNANFVSIANTIEQKAAESETAFESVNNTLLTKADKSELITEHTITTTNTDLNDYKTKGTYIFSSAYTPTNLPKGTEGVLLVIGDENSVLKHIWFCPGENPEIFTRNYINSAWSNWSPHSGRSYLRGSGYMKFSNGLLLQWCNNTKSMSVTYPIAYTNFVGTFVTEHAANANDDKTDAGVTSQTLQSFTYTTYGSYSYINWLAVGM